MYSDTVSLITLLVFAISAGLRHGIDLDHIAAITDITSSQKRSSLAFVYAMLYAFGHGVMVIILGAVLLLIGQSIPESVDTLFGKIIGFTLILLGLYVLLSILKDRKNFKLKSRWMLVFDAIQYGYHKLLHNFKASHHHPSLPPFGIGMIHGVGAETPTQVGAFLVLLGIGNGIKAIFFLLSFVLGIFISNLMVAGFSLYGYKKAMQNQNIYIAIGLITAIFSIVLGGLFLIQ